MAADSEPYWNHRRYLRPRHHVDYSRTSFLWKKHSPSEKSEAMPGLGPWDLNGKYYPIRHV